MTKDEIMALAEKVGLTGLSLIDVAYIESFAELVAAAEREAFIDIVARHGGSVEIEAAIRARGQQ